VFVILAAVITNQAPHPASAEREERKAARRRLGHDLRNQQEQVGIAGLLASGRQHSVHLPAVMRLMIEEMRHQEAQRRANFAIGRTAEPGEILLESCIVDLRSPSRDIGIGLFARRAERGKVVD